MEHKLLKLLESQNKEDNKIAMELLKKAPESTKKFFDKLYDTLSITSFDDDIEILQKCEYNITTIFETMSRHYRDTRVSNKTIIKWLKDARKKSV